jgi:hypothetical protein
VKLEEATAVLRPRSAWEAMDLGCAMARQHYGKLLRGWLTVALPLWAVICVLLRDHPGWAMFATIWTKPLLTRQPVFFMSRALFGQPPDAGQFWRNWRVVFRGSPAALTFKRFAMQRSFRLPVILLEGQRGQHYARRAAVLSAHGGGSAAGLTFACSMLELAVTSALLFLSYRVVTAFAPEWYASLGLDILTSFVLPDAVLWTMTGAVMAGVALIEPFYGAAGFALYINSRTHLEGWDIEVAFRRLSARLLPAAPAATAAVMLALGLFIAAPVQAQENDPKSVVQEILKQDDFELQKRQRPVYREEEQETKVKLEPSSTAAPATAGGMSFLGYAIIAAAVVVVAWLIISNLSAVRRGRGSGGSESRTGPRVVMGMDLSPESLPEDIPQAAWREYMAGRPLDALRLLYRGSLAWLVTRAGLPVHESDTEGDCLRHTEQLPDQPRASFFTTLTAAWINCAYAGVPPAELPMKQLCEQWPFSLRQRPDARGTAAAALVLLLPVAALLLASCDTRKPIRYEEEIIGYKGAARFNPWLAAERMLTEIGTPSSTRPGLTELPDADTAIFLPADSIASRGEARRMLSWARGGGHLIVACSGTSRFHNDHDGVEKADLDREAPLFRELGIAPAESRPDMSQEVEIDGVEYALESPDRVALDVTGQPADVLAGDPAEAVLASFSHGIGRVTLLAGATPFRNYHIADADHASLLCALAALEPVRSVVFIARSEVNLWDMLKAYAWMPVLATALLIVFWLWRHLPRFGQAVPADTSAIRHFGIQLDEAGRFLSDRAGPAALLGPARRAVLQAASQRGLHQQAPDFMDQMAARSGLTHAEVSTALLDSTDKNLIAAAAALQKLQHSLGS